jgi:hypothetical protein
VLIGHLALSVGGGEEAQGESEEGDGPKHGLAEENCRQLDGGHGKVPE